MRELGAILSPPVDAIGLIRPIRPITPQQDVEFCRQLCLPAYPRWRAARAVHDRRSESLAAAVTESPGGKFKTCPLFFKNMQFRIKSTFLHILLSGGLSTCDLRRSGMVVPSPPESRASQVESLGTKRNKGQVLDFLLVREVFPGASD